MARPERSEPLGKVNLTVGRSMVTQAVKSIGDLVTCDLVTFVGCLGLSD